ncbi:flagellar assembly protein T N-terminal domain-containing protein [Shewanella sp. 10N.286.48.B5]|uniref:flagellar assembly protein T N-terminal domain-containing protein n=1 Tax=Shewanella sp. 10N.286.48.B5 TaxID=1880834 RepID=UPI0039A74715
MKKIISYLFSISSLITISFSAHASWYEVTGTAAIVSSEESARVHALEDAVYKAVQFSGADIGSISNLTPYLDASKKEFQFTNHEVRYILVDKVKTRGGNLMITARIDIYPSANACHESQYKKTFLVGNIDVTSPQQAVMGRIYNIGEAAHEKRESVSR